MRSCDSQSLAAGSVVGSTLSCVEDDPAAELSSRLSTPSLLVVALGPTVAETPFGSAARSSYYDTVDERKKKTRVYSRLFDKVRFRM